jgi:phosphatidylglycerol:prolipoprotein diacylglycerol transferase
MYYYGLAYTLGFLGTYFWFLKRKDRLGLKTEEIYDLLILVIVCVLVFGRVFEIVIYEWGYYAEHPFEILKYWHGGMASHGVLLGGVMGIFLFSLWRKKSFVQIIDEMAIPAAFFLALGRIGNFINGQIFGYVSNVWWAIKFPDAEGFRHPVALYESLKNFLIVPILLFVRTKSFSGQGLLIAHFVFWYGFLRLFTDYFREYGDEFLGIGTGQYFNLFMAVFGIGLFIWSTRRGREQSVIDSFTGKPVRLSPVGERSSGKSLLANRVLLNLKKIIFVMLLIFSLTIPSSWTQGVLKQYRERQKTQQESLTKELVLTRPAIAESLPDSES